MGNFLWTTDSPTPTIEGTSLFLAPSGVALPSWLVQFCLAHVVPEDSAVLWSAPGPANTCHLLSSFRPYSPIPLFLQFPLSTVLICHNCIGTKSFLTPTSISSVTPKPDLSSCPLLASSSLSLPPTPMSRPNFLLLCLVVGSVQPFSFGGLSAWRAVVSLMFFSLCLEG